MNIRQATIEDAQKLLDYLAVFWADGCDTVFYKETLPSLEKEQEWLSGMDGINNVFYVAEDDGKIVGSIDGSIPKQRELKHTCNFGMSVLLNYRNQGLGTKLIQAFLSWAEKKDVRIVGLEVFSINTSAIGLYSSLGFHEDGRIKNGVKLQNGEFCDFIHMSKHI